MTISELEKVLKPDLKKLEALGYPPGTIHACIERYLGCRDRYMPFLEQLSKAFLSDPEISGSVHSVRYRTKDPSHLAAKLVRKCLDKDKPKLITSDVLFDPIRGVTDFGGIRVLHLYKSQWVQIHKYVTETLCPASFDVVEQRAYIRRGQDGKFYQKAYNNAVGFEADQVKQHEFDYASLHYLLHPRAAADDIYIECQIRTVFEEGWGEIDHAWRYPDGANVIVSNQLQILNNTSSLANDLATALGDMKNFLPTFIPWAVEQRLERSADEVHCATPRLDWAAHYLDEFIAQIRASEVKYTYWYMNTPEASANVKLVEDRLELEKLPHRVSFRYIPGLVSEIFPLFSDVLLLKNALNPISLQYQDIAVMAAPVQTTVRVQDHLDIVIYDLRTVAAIRSFFDQLMAKLAKL